MRTKNGTAIESLFPLLFLMVISIIALIMFSSCSTKAEISKDAQSRLFELQTAEKLLLYYLDSPISNNKKISDLITESVAKNDYPELQKETSKILEDFFPNVQKGITIRDQRDVELMTIGTKIIKLQIPKISTAILPMPKNTGGISYVKIELRVGD